MIDKDMLLQWLQDEKAIYKDDNIYYAEKAFLVNSIIQWCAKRKRLKNISNDELDRHFHSLRLFLQNKLDLFWEDGIINMRVLRKKRARRKKNTNDETETQD